MVHLLACMYVYVCICVCVGACAFSRALVDLKEECLFMFHCGVSHAFPHAVVASVGDSGWRGGFSYKEFVASLRVSMSLWHFKLCLDVEV